jgi:hypothetical protein
VVAILGSPALQFTAAGFVFVFSFSIAYLHKTNTNPCVFNIGHSRQLANWLFIFHRELHSQEARTTPNAIALHWASLTHAEGS